MRVKPINPATAAGLIDPHTKRSPFVDMTTGEPLAVAEVPDNVHWRRRIRGGELELVTETATPTGREPVATLTTR